MQSKNLKIIIDSQAPEECNRFLIGCVSAKYDLIKPTTFIQNCI